MDTATVGDASRAAFRDGLATRCGLAARAGLAARGAAGHGGTTVRAGTAMPDAAGIGSPRPVALALDVLPADAVAIARRAWREVTWALRAVDDRASLLLLLGEHDVTHAELADRLGRTGLAFGGRAVFR